MFFEIERDKKAFYLMTDNICGAHFHRSTEIMYVLSGEKHAYIDGAEYVLHGGEVLVCPPYSLHCFPPSEDSEQIVATVPSEYCGRFAMMCGAYRPETYVVKDEDGTLLKCMYRLENITNEIFFEGAANFILGYFSENVKFMPVSNKRENSPLLKIAEYIDVNYDKPLSLKHLSNEFGYSPNYFSTFFKKNFRAGITEYINSVRVVKSLALLETHQISSVYYLCGFSCPQQYFLNFKKTFGISPKQYLKRKTSGKADNKEISIKTAEQ